MATYIQTTLDKLDAAIGGYAESVFTASAGAIASTLQAMGVVGLALLAANTLMQWVPIRVGEYFRWGVRYVIITAVATSWAQFLPFYDIITNVPGSIGAEMLGVTGAPNLNVALDEMITGLFDFSDRAAEEAGMFSISLMSVIIWVMGALMAVVAIIVSALAKVGLAVAVSLAPFFIPMLMFKATGNLFESWVRFTLGFAMIPLVLAGVMGAIIGIGTAMVGEAGGAADVSEAAAFIIVAAAAIFLMAQVPTLVNGLAGTITATANGIAIAGGGAGFGTSATGAAARMAMPQVAAAMSALGAARAAGTAPQAGGSSSDGSSRPSPGETRVQAMVADYKRTKAARQHYAARYAEHEATRGEQSSWGGRLAAANAGQLVQARENAAKRAEARAKVRQDRRTGAGNIRQGMKLIEDKTAETAAPPRGPHKTD